MSAGCTWDVEGKQYFDFERIQRREPRPLPSAHREGHARPNGQARPTSRAFYNSILGPYEKFVTEYFGGDKVLPMNTGAEAVVRNRHQNRAEMGLRREGRACRGSRNHHLLQLSTAA